MFSALFNSFESGMIYAIMALGVYLTFRILDFPDMTVEGSFVTGASVAAIMIVNGFLADRCHVECHGGRVHRWDDNGFPAYERENQSSLGRYLNDDCALFDQFEDHGCIQHTVAFSNNHYHEYPGCLGWHRAGQFVEWSFILRGSR